MATCMLKMLQYYSTKILHKMAAEFILRMTFPVTLVSLLLIAFSVAFFTALV